MRQDIKDNLARLRFERDKFKSMSTERRKEVTKARQERRHMDALHAMIRMHEYAASARQWQDQINLIRAANKS